MKRLLPTQPIYWIGGSPCAGKSSATEILAREWDLPAYHVDEAFGRHRLSLQSDAQPTLTKWTTTPWDLLWMQPSAVLLQEAIACYREHFTIILQDLMEWPPDRPLLVEGTALLPSCVVEAIGPQPSALWMVPTAKFQLQHYARRGAWVHEVLAQCRDPAAAFRNWMERDISFARWIQGETDRYRLRLVTVDGSERPEDLARRLGSTLFC